LHSQKQQVRLNMTHFFMNNDEHYCEIIRHNKGVELTMDSDEEAGFVFVISGKIDYYFGNSAVKTACTDDFFILPSQVNYSIKFTELSILFCFYIPTDSDFYTRINKKTDFSVSKFSTSGAILKMDSFIRNSVKLFISAIDRGFVGKQFMMAQMEILLLAIYKIYTVDQIADFFAPLQFDRFDNKFKHVVLQNKNRMFKVADYANAVCMTRPTFQRHFERAFNMPPQKWIMQNRQNMICDELQNDTKSLSQISVLTGFKSVREFFAYCKKHFGKTAATIRKEAIRQKSMRRAPPFAAKQ